MGWTIAMLFFSALLTTFAVGALIWLRRPAEPRERPAGGPADSPDPEASNATRYLPYEMLGFSSVPVPAAPPASEATEYIPIERLPVMAAFRRQEAARVAAVMASNEDATAYVSLAETLQALEPEIPAPRWEVDEYIAPPPKPAMDPEHVGLGSEDLAPLFELAVVAFVAWQTDMTSSAAPLSTIAAGTERGWAEKMAMLIGASEVGSRAVFDSTMLDRDAPLDRRVVACLARLAREPAATLRQIEQLVESDDAAASVVALRCWSSHEADALLVEQAKRVDVQRTHFWLDRLLDRGLAPGDALVEELLDADDPATLERGLDSLCLADQPARHKATIQRHYFATHTAVRVAAVRAGVFLGDRTAWLHGRQLATDVATPRATELIAMLAGPTEQDSLIDWAERAAITEAQVWALALTGRPRAIELASRRLARTRGELRTAEALRHGIGGEVDESDASLLTRWNTRKTTMLAERRYLVGQLHDTEAQRTCLTRHKLVHRRAVAEELLFRSGGTCRLRCYGLAADLERQLSIVETLDLDPSAGFPWR
jgi:hypothetical protein